MKNLPNEQSDPLNLSIHVEPTFVALSEQYLAVGFKNHAWFYQLRDDTSAAAAGGIRAKDMPIKELIKMGEKEYLNSVIGMQLSGDYVAAFMGAQLQLHSVSILKAF